MPDNTRPWTRDDIVNRAYEWEPLLGYWMLPDRSDGGTIFYPPASISRPRYAYFPAGGSRSQVTWNPTQYIASDCSAFASWCWNMTAKHTTPYFSPTNPRYHRGNPNTASTIEGCYSGIQRGDILWLDGHVGVYVGNNTCIELYRSDWSKSANGHGGRISSRRDFSGYCSWDVIASADYDEDDPNYDPWDGSPNDPWVPPEGDPGTSDESSIIVIADNMYTKRYRKMKNWRYY